jgi:hypothetical protein
MRLDRIPLLVAAACLSALPAFTQTNFQYQSYTTPNDAGVSLAAPNSYVADFNGDGYADVLTTSQFNCLSGKCTPGFGLYLYMNNGAGTLKAPLELPVSGPESSDFAMQQLVAISDFNGDGKLDIAVLNPSGSIEMLYGNGDGTFRNPVTITLPAGTYSSLVEADFDVNNTQDLAALNQNGTLVLLFNDGKGNFTQQDVTIDTPPSGNTDDELVAGDFNGDGRPDIAWVDQGYASSGNNIVWSALNTAKGGFSTKREVGTLPETSYNLANLLSAALNLDGKSDLIAWTSQLSEECCSQMPVTAYYSNGDGTFTSSVVATTYATSIGVSDINGDGNPDILIANDMEVEVYTGNGNRTFTDAGDYTGLPGGASQFGIGFFSDTADPGNNADPIGFAAPNGGGSGYGNYPNDFYVVQNDNPQGNCVFPSKPGINPCIAGEEGNGVLMKGTVHPQVAPVRDIQLWANGEKLYQVESNEFSAQLNVPVGTAVTVEAVNANGATQTDTVQTGIYQTCSAPSSPGVHVCAPTQGETVTSPVTFLASGTGASGTVNHLELWIDGSKIDNYYSSTLDTTVTEPAGTHTATIIEVDSKGADVKSTPVTYTVSGTSGGCAAPSSPGVDVCAPTQGETTSSPVKVMATGKGASGTVNHLELWVDGSKIGNYSGATMDTSVALAAGTHTATIIEVDSKGAYVKSSPVSFTVK